MIWLPPKRSCAEQIARYERDRLTPADFVPKVRTHPLMAVTQKSKMQSAEEVSVNYAGQRMQTIRFPERPGPDLEANLELARRFFRSLGDPAVVSPQPSWKNVETYRVTDFLTQFRVMPQTGIDPTSVVAYISKQRGNGELTRWRVLLACSKESRDEPLWKDDLGVAGLPEISLIARTRKKNDPTSLGVVTDPDDELLGLSQEDVETAQEEARDGLHDSVAEAYRAHRDPREGLLMIYPISAAAEPRPNSTTRIPLFAEPNKAGTLVAYAVSFPFSESEATVEYVSAPAPQGTL